jgi:hypothetical protein
MTDTLRLKEDFIKVTDFRHELSGLRERFDKRMRDDPAILPVEVVTEGGTPAVVVMPWRAWEFVREMIFLMRAAEDIEAGRVTKLPGGLSSKDTFEKMRERSRELFKGRDK